MRKHLAIPLAAIPLLVGCASITSQESQPKIVVQLSDKEKKAIDDIIYETQKVLSSIDDLRNSKALGYVKKLKYPGWVVEHKKEKIAFLTRKVFVAYKIFTIPDSCVKTVDNAEMNVCHIKLKKTLTNLGETFKCNVNVKEIKGYPLKEKVEIKCSY